MQVVHHGEHGLTLKEGAGIELGGAGLGLGDCEVQISP